MVSAIPPVAMIRTPYKEKFAIPRQPGLVPEAQGEVQLLAPYNDPDTLMGLEQFSHLWLLFQFHQNLEQGWRAKVRPPRLGGNKKLGVFATRSTFRPNGIGMSVVKLLKVNRDVAPYGLTVSGVDLLDQTPIIDIKPYLPYADSQPEALGGFAAAPPLAIDVQFAPEAQAVLSEVQVQYPQLSALIQGVLAQDPRPAYKQKDTEEQQYAVRLSDFNITWRQQGSEIVVTRIDKL